MSTDHSLTILYLNIPTLLWHNILYQFYTKPYHTIYILLYPSLPLYTTSDIISIHKYHASPPHTPPRHTIYHAVPYYTTPYDTIRHNTTPYHTIPYHTTSYYAIPYNTIPHHAIPYSTTPHHAMPCHIPYQTITYHTIPYYNVLCHIIL